MKSSYDDDQDLKSMDFDTNGLKTTYEAATPIHDLANTKAMS